MFPCEAIKNRRLVQFSYDGHPRRVVPAAHGSHVTTGNEVLRGYQIGGTSSSREIPLWDLFLVGKIVDAEILDEGFAEDPPGFVRGDKHIDVHCEL